MVRVEGEAMSEVRSQGEAALPGVPSDRGTSEDPRERPKEDPLYRWGFDVTTQAIELMRSLAATGMSGAAKMGCTLAVVERLLEQIRPAIPVPSWAKFAQALVSRLVMATFGRIFAGVIEAIYKQLIRRSDSESPS